MNTYEADLIRRARELQRLVTKRNRLRRNLRVVEKDIKAARKLLKAIQQASEGRRPDVIPSHLHAGTTGIGVLHPERPVWPLADVPKTGDITIETLQRAEDTIHAKEHAS
jgi:hypothetical protein